MEFDTTKLKQAGFRKTVSHDNCIVLDIGSGSFPRYIDVRPPGDDGSRMTALWDGSLNLAVNDTVICDEYSGNPIWRIKSKGGSDSGADSVSVSKLYESDFDNVALEADASGNLTINGTGTLTIPTDLIHAGDTDTKLSFTDDQWDLTVGGVNMIRATETAQDTLRLGDVAATGDVDIYFNGNNQMVLRGSDGTLGVGGWPDTDTIVHITKTVTSSAVNERALKVEVTFDGSGGGASAMAIQAEHTPSSSVNTVYGANYNTTITPPSGVTVTNVHSLWSKINTGSDSGIITNANVLTLSAPSLGTIKPVNLRGLNISNQGASGITTTTALNIASQSGSTNNYAAIMRGIVGIGAATSPQGLLHAYDTISGLLFWEYDGLDATVRTIIPNDSGDVLYRLFAAYVIRDSSGNAVSNITGVNNGASVNITVGANTVRLRVNANGAADIARTAGTDTIKVVLFLIWL
jgi:hypothetical protein